MFKSTKLVLWGISVLLGTGMLVACSQATPEVLPLGGNPLPTAVVGVSVGTAPDSQAASAPEETYKRYINDSIAALVDAQAQKINMRQRYQSPDQTTLDLGGLLTEISILDDRTEISKPTDSSANASVAMDVRIKYADGDSQSYSCDYKVAMQSGANTKNETVWYVINPDVFPAFAPGVCVLK